MSGNHWWYWRYRACICLFEDAGHTYFRYHRWSPESLHSDRVMRKKRKPMDPSYTAKLAVNDSKSFIWRSWALWVQVFVVLSNRPVVSCLSGDDQTNTFVLPICASIEESYLETWTEEKHDVTGIILIHLRTLLEMSLSSWAFGPPTTLGRAFGDGPGVLHGFSVRRPYQVVLEGTLWCHSTACVLGGVCHLLLHQAVSKFHYRLCWT